jgi:FkbM family methyltransferase
MLLDFDNLILKYNLSISGIFHAGAHYGEEYASYKKNGVDNIVFFEPITSTFAILANNLKHDDGVFLVNSALGNEEGERTIHIDLENAGQSSSLLEPDLHLIQYPTIHFTSTEIIKITTLDKFIEKYPFTSAHNFLYMDVQGFELEILKGASNTLPTIDYVFTEVNRESLYKGCAKIDEMDSYLATYGFKRVETIWTGVSWGDAFYIK